MRERTQQEIIQQCTARYAELEAEHARRLERQALPRCADCRWCDQRQRSDPSYWRCNEPLVRGFKQEGPWIYDAPDGSGRDDCGLCGPEKALWQPARRWRGLARSGRWTAVASLAAGVVVGFEAALYALGGTGIVVLVDGVLAVLIISGWN